MIEKKEIKYSKCPYSPEELEQFRGKDGFIDLSKANIALEDGSRNQVGTIDIFKYWVDFNGTKILLKQEKMLNHEQNFTIYSEMIMYEMAKKLGIPSARCDLFKFGDKFRGIMSYMALDPSKESLMMTDELIGDPPFLDDGGDTTDFIKTEKRIKEKLYEFGLTEDDVQRIIADRRKQKVLQLFSCEMDNHIENEGFIISRDTSGNIRMRVAPMFDNEHSFGLGCTAKDLEMDELQDNIEEMYYSKLLKKGYVQIRENQYPSKKTLDFILNCGRDKIAQLLMGYTAHRNRVRLNGLQLVPSELVEFEGAMEVDSTLGYLMFEDDDFATTGETIHKILNQINPSEILSEIENHIHAPLPDIVETQLEKFVKMRKQALKCIYSMDLTELEKYGKFADEMITFANENIDKVKDNPKKQPNDRTDS